MCSRCCKVVLCLHVISDVLDTRGFVVNVDDLSPVLLPLLLGYLRCAAVDRGVDEAEAAASGRRHLAAAWMPGAPSGLQSVHCEVLFAGRTGRAVAGGKEDSQCPMLNHNAACAGQALDRCRHPCHTACALKKVLFEPSAAGGPAVISRSTSPRANLIWSFCGNSSGWFPQPALSPRTSVVTSQFSFHGVLLKIQGFDLQQPSYLCKTCTTKGTLHCYLCLDHLGSHNVDTRRTTVRGTERGPPLVWRVAKLNSTALHRLQRGMQIDLKTPKQKNQT